MSGDVAFICTLFGNGSVKDVFEVAVVTIVACVQYLTSTVLCKELHPISDDAVIKGNAWIGARKLKRLHVTYDLHRNCGNLHTIGRHLDGAGALVASLCLDAEPEETIKVALSLIQVCCVWRIVIHLGICSIKIINVVIFKTLPIRTKARGALYAV